jgi:hypothetical protein
MTTPDGWQVELVRFGPDPRFRVTCGDAGTGGAGGRAGVTVSLAELVSVLGESFELLGPAMNAGAARREPACV